MILRVFLIECATVTANITAIASFFELKLVIKNFILDFGQYHGGITTTNCGVFNCHQEEPRAIK
jgi:hypothetical protein